MKRKGLILAVVLIMALMLAVGCGKDDKTKVSDNSGLRDNMVADNNGVMDRARTDAEVGRDEIRNDMNDLREDMRDTAQDMMDRDNESRINDSVKARERAQQDKELAQNNSGNWSVRNSGIGMNGTMNNL